MRSAASLAESAVIGLEQLGAIPGQVGEQMQPHRVAEPEHRAGGLQLLVIGDDGDPVGGVGEVGPEQRRGPRLAAVDLDLGNRRRLEPLDQHDVRPGEVAPRQALGIGVIGAALDDHPLGGRRDQDPLGLPLVEVPVAVAAVPVDVRRVRGMLDGHHPLAFAHELGDRATASVVLPVFFNPMIEMMRARHSVVRLAEVVRGVDVEEELFGITPPPHLLQREDTDFHVRVEGDGPTIAPGQCGGNGGSAGGAVGGAHRLQAAPAVAGRQEGIESLLEAGSQAHGAVRPGRKACPRRRRPRGQGRPSPP